MKYLVPVSIAFQALSLASLVVQRQGLSVFVFAAATIAQCLFVCLERRTLSDYELLTSEIKVLRSKVDSISLSVGGGFGG